MKTKLKFMVWLVAAGILIGSMQAWAGSQEDPEITDKEGDVGIIGGTPLPGLPADVVDITQAWFFGETDTTLNAAVQLKGLLSESVQQLAELVSVFYDIYFSIKDKNYYVRSTADISEGPAIIYTFTLYDADSGDEISIINGSVDGSNSIIYFTIPKNLIGSPSPGDILFNNRAFASASGFEELLNDFAPDATMEYGPGPPPHYNYTYAFGRNYTFGGAGAGAISISLMPASLTISKGQTRSAIITVFNNGTADDNVTFTGSWEGDQSNGCTASFNPTTLSVQANGTAFSTITINAPADAAEGTVIYNILATSQAGGTANSALTVTISAGPAVIYGVDVTAPSGKTAKPGDVITYTFTVKNTGTADDTYDLTATSSNGWNVQIVGGATVQISRNSQKNVDVKLTVPSDAADKTTDTLTFKATSRGDSTKFKQVTVTTTVSLAGAPGILDQMNEFADGLLGSVVDSLGLRDVLGDYAPLILLLALVILLLLIVLLILLASRTPFKMVCEDNAHDVKRGKDTQYQIIITTKKKKKKGISVLLETGIVPEGWNASLDKTQVTVRRKEPQTVLLTVQPPAEAPAGAFADIQLTGYKARIKKGELRKTKKKRRISTKTTVIIPVPQVQISNVTNIPAEAKRGERVLSIIEIENQEDAEAQGVKCNLYVNNVPVHSEILSVPANSKVSVKKSWIAEADVNEVRVTIE